ncbi:voltage-gated potassium channel [Catenulispora sp. MAP12-49]|uniref:potassium channel family protein n=1 Tax=Catenulispora sp. MAP12-49 TaxID=3156302 RepID=UPI0035148DF3
MLPRAVSGPLWAVFKRVLLALGILVLSAVIVYLGRAGYRDSSGKPIGWLTAFYYATVTLSTTGYGDVVPVSDPARLINTLVVTPLRVLFLLVLVGTTLEVLTERTRTEWRQERWRSKVRDHTVVVGYGTKGSSAVQTLLKNGHSPESIVVVDTDPARIAEANRRGLAGILGDGSRGEVLERAEVAKARNVVISANRDDTAVLTTLTVRRLTRRATVVASVREAENAPLLRQSGASSVVTSSDTAGQLLGVATISPKVSQVVQDLLSYGDGLELLERPADTGDAGKEPGAVKEPVLAVIRGSRTMRYDDVAIGTIELTDRLVVVRSVHNRRADPAPRRAGRTEMPGRPGISG